LSGATALTANVYPSTSPAAGPTSKTCPDARTWSKPSPSSAAQPTSPARDVEIRRLACLKAAATFAARRCLGGNDVKSADVLKIAEAFEQWVLKGGQ
jgi:hypothetical protein